MKLANLSNGQQIAFDDSMPDDHIDDIVGKVVGAGKHAEMTELFAGALQGIASLVKALQTSTAAHTQLMVGLANSMGMLDKTIGGIPQAIALSAAASQQANAEVSEKLDAIAAIYGAPRELIMKDGEPVGVRIKGH